MLSLPKEQRTLKQNLLLASSTAFVSGVTNVVGMVAFLAFTSNITGHVANLAQHIVQQNYREIIVFLIWLFMFFAGAFVSSFIIRSLEHSGNKKANSIPMLIEAVLLLLVAIYGHHFYEETKLEREIVISTILFSMGLQNSLVSTISGGLIKTTHLTGLFTDLGGDISEWLHPQSKKTEVVRNKIYIRFTVLGFYFIGGILGGFFFNLFDLAIFYFVPLILFSIMYYDLSPLSFKKLGHIFSSSKDSAVIKP